VVILQRPLVTRVQYLFVMMTLHILLPTLHDNSKLTLAKHDDKKHAIVGFIAANPAREWAKKPYEERRRAVLQNYARWWGEQALTPRFCISNVRDLVHNLLTHGRY
jgi:hypothetical protein